MAALPLRWFRSRPTSSPGYETEVREVPLSRLCLCAFHCWDLDEREETTPGDDLCVGLGFPEDRREGLNILRHRIAPLIAAARAAGVMVCHVEPGWLAENMGWVPAQPGGPALPDGPEGERIRRAHGDYSALLGRVGRSRRAIPADCEPRYVWSQDMARDLRGRGVSHVFYAGFAADMCLVEEACGGRAMLRAGFEPVLVCDCTRAVEHPLRSDRDSTDYTSRAVWLWEWTIGYSISSAEVGSALAAREVGRG